MVISNMHLYLQTSQCINPIPSEVCVLTTVGKLFSSAICLPYSQIWAIIEGKALLARF